MTVKTLGAFVRERRERRGWTQGRLAEAIGVSGAYVSQIETGATKLPGGHLRRRLAQVLGVRHVDLLIAAGELAPDELPGDGGWEGDAPDTPQRRLAALAPLLTDRQADSLLNIASVFGRDAPSGAASEAPAPAPAESIP